jgi:hypothetical protein
MLSPGLSPGGSGRGLDVTMPTDNGRMRKRAGIVLAVAATLLALGAVASAVRPLGRAVDAQAERACAPGIVAFFPSDPLPRSDPAYAVSEDCYRRARTAAGQAILAGLAAAILGIVSVQLLWTKGRRIPRRDDPR